MRRDPLPWLLFVILALLGAVAWFTRYPESPALDRMTEWPVIGPTAERFREFYRSPTVPPESVEPETEVVVIGREVVGPRPGRSTQSSLGRVWVRAGTELRESPDAASPVVETVDAILQMRLIERRGEWHRVSGIGYHGSLAEGWLHRADVREPSPEELWQPQPVLPLLAVQPAAELLAEARELMGDDSTEMPCGPYLLLTDLEDRALARRCPRLAGELDRLYASRIGLDPVSEPAEAILLFRSYGAYLIFRLRVSPESRRHAFAAPARGIVALAAEGKRIEQLQATLVHELTHLLNRRYLGPALPSWLDEGLAEELSMSRVEDDGALVPGSLGRWQAGSEQALLVGGGGVQLARLRAELGRGSLARLEELVRLDREGFQAEGRTQTHYSLSGFWVRYLLSGESPGGVRGFRSFLAAVAGGEPLDEQLLLSSLGADWDELESGFHEWLATGADEKGVHREP
jgi:hypothetical protein